tara:strand:- start:772 stop:1341 length:570 start_codon:yes stop_codon:yes gene_type:complete
MSTATESCSRDSFQKVIQEHDRLLILFRQKGCMPCDNYAQLVKGESPNLKDVEVAEIDLGEGEMDCERLADEHQVARTPTLVYYEGGQKKRSWVPSGVPETDRQQLMDLANKTFGELEEKREPQEDLGTEDSPGGISFIVGGKDLKEEEPSTSLATAEPKEEEPSTSLARPEPKEEDELSTPVSATSSA